MGAKRYSTIQRINYEQYRPQFRFPVPYLDVPAWGLRFVSVEPSRMNIRKALELHIWDECILRRDYFHHDDPEWGRVEPLKARPLPDGRREYWRETHAGLLLIGHLGTPPPYVSIFRLCNSGGFTFGGFDIPTKFMSRKSELALQNTRYGEDLHEKMIDYLSKRMSAPGEGYAYHLARARIEGPSYAATPFDLMNLRERGPHRGGLGTRMPLSLTRVEALTSHDTAAAVPILQARGAA